MALHTGSIGGAPPESNVIPIHRDPPASPEPSVILPPLDPDLATLNANPDAPGLSTAELHAQWADWRDGAKLSVVMIGKQVGQFLGSVLPQLPGDCHEIIYLDTGSTDNSVEIAKACGAKVYHTVWRHSFAAARNEALQYATGDHVMSLDCDEILARQGAQGIRRLNHTLAQSAGQPCAYWVEVEMQNDPNPAAPEGELNVQLRCFPRMIGDTPAHWHFRIHEQVGDVMASRGIHDWRLSGVRIRHIGYQSDDLNRAKVSRNREYLKHELEHGADYCDICSMQPHRPAYILHYHMAKCAAAMGLYNEALGEIITCARDPEARGKEDWVQLQSAYRMWGELLAQNGSPDKAIRVWTEAAELMPTVPLFPTLTGGVLRLMGHREEAKKILLATLEMPWNASSSATPTIRLQVMGLQTLAQIYHDEAFEQGVGEDRRKTLLFEAERYARAAENVAQQRTVLTQEVRA